MAQAEEKEENMRGLKYKMEKVGEKGEGKPNPKVGKG